MEDTEVSTQSDNNISLELEKTLGSYTTALQKCTDAMKTNSSNNKAKIEEISTLVKEIKQKIMNANDNLKTINENRKIFDEATKEKQSQLEAAVTRSKEQNAKKMAELENKQTEAQEAARAELERIKKKTQEELGKKENELKVKHETELSEKINALNQDEEKIKLLNQQKQESEKRISELEELEQQRIQLLKDNERDMETKKNDLESAKQSLLQKQQDIDRIMTETTNQNKKIEELKKKCTELQEMLDKNIAEKKAEIEQLGEEKRGLIQEKLEAIKDEKSKNDEAIKKLQGEHDTQIEELKLKMTNEFKTMLEQAKTDAVAAAQETINKEADLKVKASQGTTKNLKEQVDQCNADKDRFTQQLIDAQKAIEGLKEEYSNGEEGSLIQLKTDVVAVGSAMDKLQEKLKVEKLLEETDELVERTSKIPGIDGTEGGDGAGSDDGKKQERSQQQEGEDIDEDIGDGWKKYFDQGSGKTYYHHKTTGLTQWNKPTKGEPKETEGKPKVDEQNNGEELHIDPDGNGIEVKGENKQLGDVVKTITTTKNNMTIRDNLLAVLDEYIKNINHEDTWGKLIERVINNHGVHDQLRGLYLSEMPLSRKNDFKKFIGWYKIMLVNMLRQSRHYPSVIKEISEYGFENTFEQLLAAAHLLIHHDDVSAIYMNDNYWSDVGTAKLAIDMWDESSTHPTKQQMKNNAKRLGLSASRRKIGGLHGYYHSVDHKAKKEQLLKPGYIGNWAGGFRHGKKSKKQNRRSLKSKLKAKKYSLKSKKRGKNKSKKRRKSIKIRIK